MRKASSTAGVLQRALVFVLLLGLVYVLSDILLLVFAAVLVAVALHGTAKGIGRASGLPVKAGIVLIVLSALLAVTAVIWTQGTALAEQSGEFWQQVRSTFEQLSGSLEATSWGRALLSDLSRLENGIGRRLASAAALTFGFAGSVIIILATGIYFSLDPRLYFNGALRLIPMPSRARGAEILLQAAHTLRWWLIGRGIDMAAVTALTYAGLLLLGIPWAIGLALIAGVLNFIPYFGALAGAVPAILVALGQGPNTALWVAALFAIIQFVEGYLLAPIIQKRTVSLPPAMTILSQTLFGFLFGGLGLLLAPALAAVLLVICRMVYVEDALGDDMKQPPLPTEGTPSSP